jgi:hypothetical protein
MGKNTGIFIFILVICVLFFCASSISGFLYISNQNKPQQQAYDNIIPSPPMPSPILTPSASSYVPVSPPALDSSQSVSSPPASTPPASTQPASTQPELNTSNLESSIKHLFSSISTNRSSIGNIPMNIPIQLKRIDGGIAAMWDKPARFGTMNNKTPLRLFTNPGTYESCVITNCAFKFISLGGGNVNIESGDNSGILTMWEKSRRDNDASKSTGLFMYNKCCGPCERDDCKFKIIVQIRNHNSGFIIASSDETGYIALRGTENGSDFYMDSNINSAVVFTFPNAG